MRINDEFEKI